MRRVPAASVLPGPAVVMIAVRVASHVPHSPGVCGWFSTGNMAFAARAATILGVVELLGGLVVGSSASRRRHALQMLTSSTEHQPDVAVFTRDGSRLAMVRCRVR